ALVSLPPAAVPDAVKALAALGARVAVILTSGFGEVDDRGGQAQQGLLDAARAGGLRLVGPNCMGVYSRPARLNATYFWDLPDVPGHVGVISQSGAYGGLILRHLGGQGIGVSRFLSIGNQVDLELADALDYLAADEETRVVACFIEAVRNGRRFVEAAARVTAGKPMVVLSVPATAPETQIELRRLLPAFAAVGNPVDMTPQVNPQHILGAAALVLSEEAVAGVVAINVGLDIPAFADGLVAAARGAKKPLIACAVDVPGVTAKLAAAGVPVYPTPERAVRAYRALWLASLPPVAPGVPAPRPTLAADLADRLGAAPGALGYEAARPILAAYGVRFCRDALAHCVDEAVAAA